jgi:MraZ protein
MNQIFGEYECKVDAKGRFLLPAGLLKQLDPESSTDFVLNRGLDQCLVLYPLKVWRAELGKIMQKNQYVAENRAFARKFQAGATPVSLDSNNRLLVPKRLAAYAGVEKELVLIGAMDRIEVWAKEAYDEWLESPENDLETLAEKVMADDDNDDDHRVS